ncbi:SGNH/GDSL hydrolase family protein [Lentilactobacillus senioris]|uniref:SGNH/GDSL hydrolase family protein n=1 Tax=Lentilactobacillus senioris TaxID=931534 RepID=UPI0022827E94|nr:SGNH/GDSL hydrolase family protein [Lentilactobacillus senioris]MCY9807346.1 SGNH/GDSL hydrolase family protein [Lentilactobacillus senioris]
MKNTYQKVTLALGLGLLVLSGAATANAAAKKKDTTDKETTVKEKPKPAASVISSTDIDEQLPYHLSGGQVYSSTDLTTTLGSWKKFANTTWYSVKDVKMDRSSQGSGNSLFTQIQSGNKKYTAWVWHGYLQPVTKGTFNIAAKDSSVFKNKKVVTLGDSITHGYDGMENLEDGTYPQWLQRYLNTSVDNLGYNGAFLATESTGGDLTTMVDKTDLSKYDVATIAYGTNDYGHSRYTLDAVKDVLVDDIHTMKQKNKKLVIYGILPITRYDNDQNSDDVAGIGGYTMNELRDMLANVYKSEGIPVLDWRNDAKQLITDSNRTYRLFDERLHPSARTYQMMGSEIAKFMIANAPEPSEKENTDKNTSKSKTQSKSKSKSSTKTTVKTKTTNKK